MIKMIDAEKASLVPMGHRDFKPVEIVNSSNIKELAIIEAGKSHPSGCDMNGVILLTLLINIFFNSFFRTFTYSTNEIFND